MSVTRKIVVFSILVLIHCCKADSPMPAADPGTNTHKLRMPGAEPRVDDAYLCAAFKLDMPVEQYITRFQVEGTAERAHHMLIYGCSGIPEEAKTKNIWDCGHHGTCSGSSRIVYAWAKNAQGMKLPSNVGFRIGGQNEGDSKPANYIVMQVHYAKKLAPELKDYTGIDLEITSQPQKFIGGIMLMAGSPDIPPFKPKVHADACCGVNTPAPMHVFAARVHAHDLGTVITGYKFNPKTNEVIEVVKGNPQWPQAFYPVKNEVVLDTGDEFLARCTYNSMTRSRHTFGGGTSADEMCNLYLMYYTDAEKGKSYDGCSYLCNKQQLEAFPADSDEPLPPNPELEAYATFGDKKNDVVAAEESNADAAVLAGIQSVNQHGGHNEEPSSSANDAAPLKEENDGSNKDSFQVVQQIVEPGQLKHYQSWRPQQYPSFQTGYQQQPYWQRQYPNYPYGQQQQYNPYYGFQGGYQPFY